MKLLSCVIMAKKLNTALLEQKKGALGTTEASDENRCVEVEVSQHWGTRS